MFELMTKPKTKVVSLSKDAILEAVKDSSTMKWLPLGKKYGMSNNGIRNLVEFVVKNGIDSIISKPDRDAAVLSDARSGLYTREEVALRNGLTEAGVKSIYIKHGFKTAPELNQKNAHKAKLIKNPNAYEDMRKARTEETFANQSKTMLDKVANDPQYMKNVKEAQAAYWETHEYGSTKYTWDDFAVALRANRLVCNISKYNQNKFDGEGEYEVVCHCNVKWKPRPIDLIYRKIISCGCVKSANEKKLLAWIQNDLGFSEAHSTYDFLGNGQELDIYVPSKKLAIEYDGLWAHSSKCGKDKNYHFNKYDICSKKGVQLLTIFSDEWFDREKQVKTYIKAKLGLNTGSVRASDCVFSLDTQKIGQFIEDNHILGFKTPGVKHYLGLEHNGVIVAAMTFKAEDRQANLNRFCVGEIKVHGGFTKLLQEFIKQFKSKYDSIVTFSDNRWSDGGLYSKNGFVLDQDLGPDYSYIKNDRERFHKSNFRKEKIAEKLGTLLPNETEKEAMERFKYYQIYDAGKKRWIYNIT